MRHAAFTLIELLVVVTIIVILLALLTPALDKAIYQAEMAVCGARLKSIVTTVQLYAAGNKRHYPDRMAGSPGSLSPHQLLGRVGTTTAATWNADVRVAIRPYLSVNKSLNDPLCKAVNLDNESPMEDVIYASYDLWYGYQYTNDKSAQPQGMYKMGDHWTWKATADSTSVDERFNVVASDFVSEDPAWGGDNSHPDHDGIATNDYRESGPNPWVVTGVNPPVSVTYSWWMAGNNPGRGAVDANYAMQDGSVRRYNDIKWGQNPQIPDLAEDVPTFGDGSTPTWSRKVPMTD